MIAQHHDKFEVVALTTNENIELLAQQVKHFQPGYVGITDDKKAEKFKSCGFTDPEILDGRILLLRLPHCRTLT